MPYHFYKVQGNSKNRTQKEQQTLVKIGSRVRSHRLKVGLTQFQLATDADIGVNQIYRIELGEINTSILTLQRIADTLNIEIAHLLNDNFEER